MASESTVQSLVTVLLCLLALTANAKPRPVLTPQQIAERTIPSIALIRGSDRLGTGFVVRADGRILTNYHVIAGVRAATISLDKKDYEVIEIVALDRDHDLVVLHIAAKNLPVLALGDSDKVKPGQPVIAIGHPLGLGNTVSNGLVSAVREVEKGLQLLQVSAPISPGSSGGPLLEEHGDVIGVSTLVSTGGQNLNFGMPINYVKQLLAAKEQPLPLADLADAVQPGIRRDVPHHELSLLGGCANAERHQLLRAIGEAIELGAPLYNEGNHEACYRIYESTILELDRSMPACANARGALKDGLKVAEGKTGATAKAWALRDAFDGLIDVLERSELGAAADPAAKVVRAVPHHELSLIATCSDEALKRVEDGIASAIELGAPLFNKGNVEACFRVYQGAALELNRTVPKCPGVKKALNDGVTKANAAGSADAKAWAMRDAFDGLLEVLARRGEPKERVR